MALNERYTFEADTTGAMPAGWAAVGSGDWEVHTTTPAEGARSFGQTDATTFNGAVVLRSGMTPQADMRVVALQRWQWTDGSNNQAASTVLRASADGQNFYLCAVSNGTAELRAELYSCVAGSFANIGSVAGHGQTMADGDLFWVKAEVQGTTVRCRVWKDGTAEPATWTVSATNSAVTDPGVYGFRSAKTGTYAAPAVIDDVRGSDAGVDWVLVATEIELSGPTVGVVGEVSTFTLTLDGTYTGSGTPSDTGGGTIDPASITWTAEDDARTFTVTPVTAGESVISFAESPALTGPTGITFTALAATTEAREASVGAFPTGLATVGYVLYNADGTVFRSRVTAGVSESTFPPGTYSASITVPASFSGFIAWSESDGGTEYYSDFEPNPEEGGGGGGSGVVVSSTVLDGLIQLPAVVIIPDDADYVFQVESDEDLSEMSLRLTIREDPSWSARWKTLITDDRRKWLEEDLSEWEVVFSSTTTTDPASGYAAAIVVPRASMALLTPGRHRYVLQVQNTTEGAYAPVIPPTWTSVYSNADLGAT